MLRLLGYDMDAAFMSLEQRGCGIHVVRSGAGGAKVTKVRSRVRMMSSAPYDPGLMVSAGQVVVLQTIRRIRPVSPQ